MKKKSGFRGRTIDFESDSKYDIGYAVNTMVRCIKSMLEYHQECLEDKDLCDEVKLPYNSMRYVDEQFKVIKEEIESIDIKDDVLYVNDIVIPLDEIAKIAYYDQKLFFASSEVDEPHLITASIILKPLDEDGYNRSLALTFCINWCWNGDDGF